MKKVPKRVELVFLGAEKDKHKFSINVESGAGALASFRDAGNLVTLFPIITQFII